MKKTLLVPALIVMLLWGLTGCASFTTYQYENAVEGILSALNRGQAEELVKASSVPFLVDREIILLPKDLALFWHNITTAQFTLTGAVIRENQSVDQDTYGLFAPTMEGKAFFENYVTPQAYRVVIETATLRLTLLLDRAKGGKRILKGWKGPEPL